MRKCCQRDELQIVQELRAIYLLEMTKCLTGMFGKGLHWDIQNRASYTVGQWTPNNGRQRSFMAYKLLMFGILTFTYTQYGI